MVQNARVWVLGRFRTLIERPGSAKLVANESQGDFQGAPNGPRESQEGTKTRQHEAHMTPKGSQKGVQSDPDGLKTGLGTVTAEKSKMLQTTMCFPCFLRLGRLQSGSKWRSWRARIHRWDLDTCQVALSCVGQGQDIARTGPGQVLGRPAGPGQVAGQVLMRGLAASVVHIAKATLQFLQIDMYMYKY